MEALAHEFYPWLRKDLDKLTARASDKKLAHAWVFYGQMGVGKTAFIKQLAQEILAKDDPHKQEWVKSNIHPDFMLVEPNENGRILIDTVRETIDFLGNTSAAGAHKVVCFVQAEKMNVAAQSALLKTLEEPLGQTFLFLTTETPNQLLPTVMSRCQKQKIEAPAPLEFENWLKEQKLACLPPEIDLAKKLANCSPGLTLSLLSETASKSLPMLLYLVSVVVSHWEPIPGLKAFVEKNLGVVLPDYVYSPHTALDKKSKIELYRYVCRLREKAQLFSGLNTKLLLHSIEHFTLSNKRISW